MSDQFKVIINHEEQYSILPVSQSTPSGWREVNKQGPKEACLQYIEEVWTDMRPLSVRKRVQELAKGLAKR